MKFFRRALSPVTSTILLVVITVGLAIALYVSSLHWSLA